LSFEKGCLVCGKLLVGKALGWIECCGYPKALN